MWIRGASILNVHWKYFWVLLYPSILSPDWGFNSIPNVAPLSVECFRASLLYLLLLYCVWHQISLLWRGSSPKQVLSVDLSWTSVMIVELSEYRTCCAWCGCTPRLFLPRTCSSTHPLFMLNASCTYPLLHFACCSAKLYCTSWTRSEIGTYTNCTTVLVHGICAQVFESNRINVIDRY